MRFYFNLSTAFVAFYVHLRTVRPVLSTTDNANENSNINRLASVFRTQPVQHITRTFCSISYIEVRPMCQQSIYITRTQSFIRNITAVANVRSHNPTAICPVMFCHTVVYLRDGDIVTTDDWQEVIYDISKSATVNDLQRSIKVISAVGTLSTADQRLTFDGHEVPCTL